MKNPDIENASYVMAKDYYEGRDAGHLIRYLWRRPANKQAPRTGGRGSWYTIPANHRLGNAESFTAAANARTSAVFVHHRKKGTQIGQNYAPWATSYVHVVISPRSRDDLTAEQIAALSEPWITDQNGEIMPHVGAVHTDGRRGQHVHIAVARNNFESGELEALKVATRGMARELEAEREIVLEQRQEMSMGEV